MTIWPASSRWLTSASFALLGAGAHAAIWLALNYLGAVSGIGRLQDLGWPFNSLLMAAASGALNGAAYGHSVYAQRIVRQAASEDPVEPLIEASADSQIDLSMLPDMPALANRVEIARRSSMETNGVTADVFDLTTKESDGDGGKRRTVRTFVLLPADGLPSFDLTPHGFGSQLLRWMGAGGMRFDAAAAETAEDGNLVKRFEAVYRLAAVSIETMMSGRTESSNDDELRRVFTPSVLRAALGRFNWQIQCDRGHLAFWTGSEPLGPQRREKLVTDAMAIHAALLAAQSGATHEQPLPAPRRAGSPEQQAARLQASVIGALIGIFAGFFSGFGLSLTDLYGQPAANHVPGDRVGGDQFFFYTMLFTVIGTFGGAIIGRSLPLRRPLLRKPSDRRREIVVASVATVGMFGGFLAGGISGMLLTMKLGLKFGDGLEPVLEFGGAGCGAIFGATILGMATNFVYKRFVSSRD